ncbi:MAG TPA: NUDIX domain-containing protein [Hyphomicrobiales bacterium]
MAGAIKVKTMALFAAKGRTLVMVCFDKVKQQRFHRLLGGHVEFGETSEEALKREMREELGTEVAVLSLLQVMQNRFVFEGRPHHEVVFIHHVRFLDETFNRREDLYNLEPHLDEPFIWIPLAEATAGPVPLYPAADYPRLFAEMGG